MAPSPVRIGSGAILALMTGIPNFCLWGKDAGPVFRAACADPDDFQKSLADQSARLIDTPLAAWGGWPVSAPLAP